MSRSIKQRAAAPSGPLSVAADGPSTKQNGQVQNGKAVSSSTLTYPAEVSDDVNMNEVNGLVYLDVTLPNGQRTEINVDYNTPMLDLMVCLAGKSKLNPTGLSLILMSEDSDKPMSYKPNQTIGSLGGRIVRIVSKDVVSGKPTNRDSKKEKPFEVTQRFTVNFPRGQKTVIRANPLMTLGSLVINVCKEKGLDLDLHKYILQIPGKPGSPVDLNATIQQVGVHEMNLVAVALQDKNHTMSMPDLSKPPSTGDQPLSYTSLTGEQKKKKGFLSFLGKKDKKNKSDAQLSFESSTSTNLKTSSSQVQRPTTPPISHKREHNPDQQITRPKSMFISSSASVDDYKSLEQNSQPLVAPARKKRRAPAPPVPTTLQASVTQTSLFSSSDSSIPSGQHGKENTLPKQILHNEIVPTITASQQEEVSTATFVSPQQLSRADMINRLHSRNSSDSSGYHELTLSGCESPEASHIGAAKYKTSIDTTSIESSDNAKGDNGIHESPTRELPIVKEKEKSHNTAVSVPSVAPVTVTSVTPVSSSQGLVPGSTDTLGNKKKRKAPTPPVPQLSAATKTVDEATDETPTDVKTTSNINDTVASEELVDNTTLSVQAHPETTHLPEPPEAEPVYSHEIGTVNTQTSMKIPESFSDNEDNAKEFEKKSEDSDINGDLNESTAFDFNDILEGIVFDDEPHSIELTFARRSDDKKWDKDPEMMMETSSVISENIEQVEMSARPDRPCAFIPPPPPSEPPPAEQPAVNLESLTFNTSHTFVDKGTDVNDEDTSIAASINLNSPDTASSGYKNEMALFVERMSRLAVESAEKRKDESQDDSVSSLSIPCSENNSDTGSVIRYLRADSRDSNSEAGSLTRKEGKKLRSADIHTHVSIFPEDSQEQLIESFAVSEEITEPVVALPPPPEFDDKDENFSDKTNDNENYFTETVEQHGPIDCDVSADHKVPKTEKKTELVSELSKDNERRGTSLLRNHIILSASVTTTTTIHTPTPTPIYQSRPKTADPQAPLTSVKKEEFVLTSEDLSTVSFLPPRSKKSKAYAQTQPYVKTLPYASSTFIEHGYPLASRTNKDDGPSNGNAASNNSQITIQSTSEVQDTMIEEKPRTLPHFSTMRPTVQPSNAPVNFDDILADISLDPLLIKSRPRLLMNSSNSSSRKSTIDPIEVDGDRKYELSHHSSFATREASSAVTERMDKPSSIAHADKLSTHDQQESFQSQYESLQTQFSQWQEQLARNQNLLVSKNIEPENKAKHLQQLTDQMAMQQQMMQQLQSTMLALQQKQEPQKQQHQNLPQQHQQQIPSYGKEYRKSGVHLKKNHEPATTSSEPVPVNATAPSLLPPPPPPSQPQPPPLVPEQKNKISKAESTTAKQRPKFKFEPQLDPREQLLMSIKNFSKGGLKSVPVQKTRHVHSNR